MRQLTILGCLIYVVFSCRDRPTTSKPPDCNPIDAITPPVLPYAVPVRPEIEYNDTHATIKCQLPPGYEKVQLFDEAERYRNGTKELSFTYYDLNWSGFFSGESTTTCDKTLKSFGVEYTEHFGGTAPSVTFVTIKKAWCYAFNRTDSIYFDRELNKQFEGSNCKPFENNLFEKSEAYPIIVQNSSMIVSVECPKVDGYNDNITELHEKVEVYNNGKLIESYPMQHPREEAYHQFSCLKIDGHAAFGDTDPWSGSFYTFTKVGCSYH